jgi:YbgC/YbaW family acyl-CoA thioester hydrolase
MPAATIMVRVPFVDVDSSMRIHFTAMFRYMELAEHELMRALGTPYTPSSLFAELAMPRVHLSCDFMGAVAFDDQLEVEARVEKVGTTSWTVAFTARKVAGPNGQAVEREETVAQGRMVIVAMDPATQRATPLPAALRHALTAE